MLVRIEGAFWHFWVDFSLVLVAGESLSHFIHDPAFRVPLPNWPLTIRPASFWLGLEAINGNLLLVPYWFLLLCLVEINKVFREHSRDILGVPALRYAPDWKTDAWIVQVTYVDWSSLVSLQLLCAVTLILRTLLIICQTVSRLRLSFNSKPSVCVSWVFLRRKGFFINSKGRLK